MKTLVFVLVPYTVPPAALLEFAEALLAPHQMRDDDRTTGRYDYLAGSPGSFDDRVAEGILPERMKRATHGRITTTAQLRDDSIPGAVVTPDGVWHDRDDRDRRSAEAWETHYHTLIAAHPLCGARVRRGAKPAVAG